MKRATWWGLLVPTFATALSPTHNNFSPDQFRQLDRRLRALEESAPASLLGFYEPQLRSFSVQPGAKRLSITSTCYALQSMLAATTNLYESKVNLDASRDQTSHDRIPVGGILRELLSSDWRQDDLFQVPVLLYTILMVDGERAVLRDPAVGSTVCKLVESVLVGRPMRRQGNRQDYSDYILFQCAQTYGLLTNTTGIPVESLPANLPSNLTLAIARSAENSFNELCRQLAFRAAGDSFDIMRLAYSLLTYVVATERLTGTAGRELVPGEGPSPGTQVPPLQRRLVVAALAAFFEEQQESGLWDKGQPIYRSFRRTGRNVGNAFIFSVDTVASLLEYLPAEMFRPHLPHLTRVLDWIEFHQKVEVVADFCDPESGQCYGLTLRGWASPHLSPEIGPQAWSTAQTWKCVSLLRRTVEELMHVDVLNEFGGRQLARDSAAWDRLLDTDLGTCGTNLPLTLKGVLHRRMIEPQEAVQCYSAILFGPPGTAKTTICEAMARRIGWDFLVIDTSVFLADGLTNVAARIRYVFERLLSLRRCVILFDEIEEFCLDRETPGLGMESRMLTTAMLTAINDLRKKEQSIFFLATNRLRAFDAAITRPGRFDLQLFVGTPNLEARRVQLEQRLTDASVSDQKKHQAVAVYIEFLDSVWNESGRFMNYLEGVQFASACANVVANGSDLTLDIMNGLLQAQLPVLTIRGPVREEYVASMDLTRL